jgi:CelD/BcsL family acetyltransferase involved in cellulose biosynthesis
MQQLDAGTGPFALEIVRTEADLVALAPEWERLWRGAAQARATQAPQWSLHYWRMLKDRPGVELFVICARIAGDLVGVIPLKLERQAGGQVLKYLGLGYDEFAGVVLRDDIDGAAVLNQVIDAMVRRGDIAKMSISNLPDESPLSAALLARKLAFTRWTKARSLIRWAKDDDWDAYLQRMRSHSSLKKHRQIHRKLVLETGAELSLERDPAVIASTVDWAFRNKITAFQDRGVEAFLEEDAHRRFTIDLASSGDPDNHIAVYSLKTPDSIIAAIIVAPGRGITEALIITHDPQYAAFSPGRIVFEESARDALSAKAEMDFGPGDHEWKRPFRTGEAAYRQVELYLSKRAAALQEPGVRVRRFLRRIKGAITHYLRQMQRKLRRPSPQ